MGVTSQPHSWEMYFTKRQKYRAKKGIIHKGLINEKYQQLSKERKDLPNTQIRLLPKKFAMPISTSIYKNKVAIFILIQKAPTTIVIESELVANSFQKYFEYIWRTAKKSS